MGERSGVRFAPAFAMLELYRHEIRSAQCARLLAAQLRSCAEAWDRRADQLERDRANALHYTDKRDLIRALPFAMERVRGGESVADAARWMAKRFIADAEQCVDIIARRVRAEEADARAARDRRVVRDAKTMGAAAAGRRHGISSSHAHRVVARALRSK